MAFVLTALGAMLAVGLELLEALAIVLAVGSTRRWRDALLGAAAAAVALAALAVVLGPVLLSRVPLAPLRVVIGVFLLLFGLEWLRKGVLRLAGLRSPSSSFQEYVEEREELEAVALPPAGQPDWAGRVISFKGVLLEGVEVILIVTALGARPGGLAPALVGGAAVGAARRGDRAGAARSAAAAAGNAPQVPRGRGAHDVRSVLHGRGARCRVARGRRRSPVHRRRARGRQPDPDRRARPSPAEVPA